LIEFRVEALDPLRLINDVHLQGDPNVLGENNNGTISVTESFLEIDDLLLNIYDDFGEVKLIDSAFLPSPVRTLNVQKGILALSTGNSATISFIDQTFSQVTIPEPAGMVLVLMGSAWAAVVIRKRHIWGIKNVMSPWNPNR
jgi:hypothetical protein